jgi:acetyl esterase/lipase
MNTRGTKTRATRRYPVVWALIVPVVALLGACEDGDPVNVIPIDEDDRYLEEIFQASEERNIQYGLALNEDGVEEALRLDLYQPIDDDAPLRPAVLWLHGGSFQQGHNGEMAEFARRSANRGYVSATADYRLRENAVFDYTDPNDPLAPEVMRDAQHDAQAAVRWLRANAAELRIDPNLIFVAGFSAGATTALRVAAWPDDPGASGNAEHSSSVAAAVGISASIDGGVLAAATGPTLLIHGDADTKVPLTQVQEACASVAQCQLVPIAGAEHNLIAPAKESIIAETATFLHARVTGA